MGNDDDLLYRLKQVEELVRFPSIGDNLENAHTLAASLGRNAPSLEIADLAARVLAAIDAMRADRTRATGDDLGLNKALWRLRLALVERKHRAP